MKIIEAFAVLPILLGAAFFLAGTIGLVRFPDVYCRLHALTKADNLGLGLVCLGAALLSGSWLVAVELLAIWLLVLMASAVSCHLIARSAWRRGVRPWTEQRD